MQPAGTHAAAPGRIPAIHDPALGRLVIAVVSQAVEITIANQFWLDLVCGPAVSLATDQGRATASA